MRVAQPQGHRGSLKWIQLAVNQHTAHLNRLVQEACGFPSDEVIEWVSPLEDDQWSEYRDAAFLDRLKLQLSARPLPEFWPSQRTSVGRSWPHQPGQRSSCGGEGQHSRGRISSQSGVACISGQNQSQSGGSAAIPESRPKHRLDGKAIPVCQPLAHLYLLRELNHIQARLLFIYFVGDEEMDGPQTVVSELQRR